MKQDAEDILASRRENLLAQIHIEREELAQAGASLRSAVQIIDKIRNGIHHLTKHPETLLLPLVITLVSRQRRFWALGISGFSIWRLIQSWRQRILS